MGRITLEMQKRILEAYSQHPSYSWVGAKLNLDPRTIGKVVENDREKVLLEPPNQKSPPPPTKAEERKQLLTRVYTDLEGGLTNLQVAKEHGLEPEEIVSLRKGFWLMTNQDQLKKTWEKHGSKVVMQRLDRILDLEAEERAASTQLGVRKTDLDLAVKTIEEKNQLEPQIMSLRENVRLLTNEDEKARKYFAQVLLEHYPSIGSTESLSELTGDLAVIVLEVRTALEREAAEREVHGKT